MRDCGDDIGRAAARRHQADRRFLRRSGVAKGHVAGAAFMLGVDEAHVRPLGDGVTNGKRGVREHAEDMAHILRAKILDNGFRNVGFGHGGYSFKDSD